MAQTQPEQMLDASQEDTYQPPVVIRNGLRLIEDDAILPIPAFVTRSILEEASITRLRAISDSIRAQRMKNEQS